MNYTTANAEGIHVSELAHRLQKNYRRLAAQFRSQNVEAWRLYAQDIPAYPYLIDLYKNYCLFYDQGREVEEAPDLVEKHHLEAKTALIDLLKIPEENIIVKRRARQSGKEQYEVIDPLADEVMRIQEGQLHFEVNLRKYLDTGLFLDHRPLRRELLRTSANKKVLNLFCYTGSLSVAAAKGGASDVLSIDMSNPYLQWARRNFLLNELKYENYRFLQADVVAWLRDVISERFDIIILDPPSFSNSKRMDDVLDIQRDHEFLISACLNRLNAGGKLFFSTNKRKFRLDTQLALQAKEITRWTVPPDFADSGIHQAWEFNWS
ncbi:MAG: class I SAM-dependent methyltransferase [Bacteriovoracaceae bacterium]|nr:class I SAM-dependent methyltransferase [Bacteriovoracaceae bacterium]